MKAICNVTLSPLRYESDDFSLMISQLLYGEKVDVLHVENGFAKVVTKFDEVTAWVDKRHLTEISEEQFNDDKGKVCRENFYANHPLGQQLILMGSELLEPHESIETQVEEIVKTAYQLLHTPYLLGGRSVMGLDASGFVQLVFKINGVYLPREASQQSERGEGLFFLDENRAGDIAFFENEEGEINHVGLMLDNNQIIHVFDRVRIDQLDSTGIYNQDLKKHTHQLRLVKRLLND